jgi:hypothetical protein
MRWLRYCLFVAVGFTFADQSFALDPLLVEFGWSQPNPVTLPANYTASVGSTPWNGVGFNTITQYPTTDFAGQNAIAFWNQSCTFGTPCSVGFANGGQQPNQFAAQFDLDVVLGGPNRLWADGWDGNAQPFTNHTGTWFAATYVPQKGNSNQALFGYQITAVERDVTATTQSLRLYGINAPVPEPSTTILMILSSLAHITARPRQRIR